MDRKYNKNLVSLAKTLRKNMTKEEKHLWYDFLKDYPVKITRQKVLGRYIVDFYCAGARLVIELDGSQHYEEENAKNDKNRTCFLEKYGLMVLRFTNTEINANFNDVCGHIDYIIKNRMEALNNPSVTLR